MLDGMGRGGHPEAACVAHWQWGHYMYKWERKKQSLSIKKKDRTVNVKEERNSLF